MRLDNDNFHSARLVYRCIVRRTFFFEYPGFMTFEQMHGQAIARDGSRSEGKSIYVISIGLHMARDVDTSTHQSLKFSLRV